MDWQSLDAGSPWCLWVTGHQAVLSPGQTYVPRCGCFESQRGGSSQVKLLRIRDQRWLVDCCHTLEITSLPLQLWPEGQLDMMLSSVESFGLVRIRLLGNRPAYSYETLLRDLFLRIKNFKGAKCCKLGFSHVESDVAETPEWRLWIGRTRHTIMVCWGAFQVISIQNVASGVWMSMELWVRFRRWNLLLMVATKMQGKKERVGPEDRLSCLGKWVRMAGITRTGEGIQWPWGVPAGRSGSSSGQTFQGGMDFRWMLRFSRNGSKIQ